MAYTDLFYHGNIAKHSFFEGWYFKHRQGNQIFSLIPGMSVNKKGKQIAFIQAVWAGGSCYIPFSFKEFYVNTTSKTIRVGQNIFSESGMILNIQTQSFSAKGALLYSNMRHLKKNSYAPGIMGPFSYLNFMECYHGILSLSHTVDGSLDWNGESIVFNQGRGYIEKDWGRSFPRSWLWLQCENFFNHKNSMAMLSIADIPFLCRHFTGILFVLSTPNAEHRIATYYGAKLIHIKKNNAIINIRIMQHYQQLDISIKNMGGYSLRAPVLGHMNRCIQESPCCDCHITLSKNGQIIWEDRSTHACFEKA